MSLFEVALVADCKHELEVKKQRSLIAGSTRVEEISPMSLFFHASCWSKWIGGRILFRRGCVFGTCYEHSSTYGEPQF